ncbi:hypothetical protein [Gracilibacillus thailandensis]|nr:hypothetical protein [Gracilibacillus thailandensis]
MAGLPIKNNTEITLKISIVPKTRAEGDLNVAIELEGNDHDVMTVAEIAQNTKVLGEAGVEHILLKVLNEEKPLHIDFDGPIQ